MWNWAGFLGLYILKPNLPLNGQAASSTDIFFLVCTHGGSSDQPYRRRVLFYTKGLYLPMHYCLHVNLQEFSQIGPSKVYTEKWTTTGRIAPPIFANRRFSN